MFAAIMPSLPASPPSPARKYEGADRSKINLRIGLGGAGKHYKAEQEVRINLPRDSNN